VRYFGQKFLRLLLVVFAVTILTFLMVNLLPGDVAYVIAGPDATPEDVETIRRQLGLDQNLLVRYAQWLFNTVRGDLGLSLLHRRPVLEGILSCLPVTVELLVISLLVSLAMAVPVGILCAYKQRSPTDHALSTVAFGLMSVPVFVMGLAMIYIFAIKLRWLPATGYVPLSAGLAANLRSMILPAVCIALIEWVPLMRVLRSDMIATLQEDYILMARSKGMPVSHILLKHALRPSSLSMITILGLQFGHLIGGAVIVETIFALPGIGRLLIDSIFGRDYNMVQGCILFVTVAYVAANFVVDTMYIVLDPRIQKEGAAGR
jgi:peptide/nickel transport system permease protein